jgi:hypothetical protein
MAITVNTKEQLKQAIKNKEKEIAIDDADLAKNVVKFKQIKKLSKRTLGLLLAATGIATVGFALAPTTGGASAVAGGISSGVIYSITLASGTVISTGSIIAIGALCIIGSAVLFAIWKDYSVIEIDSDPLRVKLIRK